MRWANSAGKNTLYVLAFLRRVHIREIMDAIGLCVRPVLFVSTKNGDSLLMKKLIAYLLVVSFMSMPLATAFADDDDEDSADYNYAQYKQVLKDIKSNKKRQDSVQKDVKKYEANARKLKNAKSPGENRGECNGCSDLAKRFCDKKKLVTNPDHPCFGDAEYCESFHLAPLPDNESCWRIKQKNTCYDSVPAQLQFRVNECWRVKNLADAEVELQKAAEAKEELEALKEDLDGETGLTAMLEEIENNCPECSSRSAYDKQMKAYGGAVGGSFAGGVGGYNNFIIQQREPSTFEKIMTGVGVGGSLLVNGLSSYYAYDAHKSGINSYNRNYQDYVANATELGIPFYPPNQFGGMSGSYMGGGTMNPFLYAGLGALSGLGGLGNGGGGGLYIGGNFGNPYSSGYGYGYPQFGAYPPGYPVNPYGPYSGGGGGWGMTGGVGVGMPGAFPYGGIFPGANGGIGVGPYASMPYQMVPVAAGPSTIFASPYPPFWGSPFGGGNMGMGYGMPPGMGGGYGMPTGMGMGIGIGMGGGYGMPPGMGMGSGYGMPTGMGMGIGIGMGGGYGMPPGMGMGAGFGVPTGMGMGYGMPPGMGMGSGYGMPTGMGMGIGIGMGGGYGMPPGMGMGSGMDVPTGMGMGYGMPPGMGMGSGYGMPTGMGMGIGMGGGFGMPPGMPPGMGNGGGPMGVPPWGYGNVGGMQPCVVQPGFPGMPNGSMYPNGGGQYNPFGSVFPGGPNMGGYWGAGGMNSPAMNNSWQMSQQYYQSMMAQYQSQMQRSQYYSQEYMTLSQQYNDIMVRYAQMQTSGGGGGYGGGYYGGGYGGGYYGGGNPPYPQPGAPGQGQPGMIIDPVMGGGSSCPSGSYYSPTQGCVQNTGTGNTQTGGSGGF